MSQALVKTVEAPATLEKFRRMLPAHVTPEKFARTVVTAIAQNPELGKCDPSSVMQAAGQAATLGLLTDGQLGQAYLVPFKGRATMIVGYKGLLKLVRQSGEIASIDVDVICENDHVVIRRGVDPTLTVEPNWKDRGEMIGAFACAQFKDGSVQFAVMTKREVDDVRNAAMSKNSPAWTKSYNEMAKKTVFRRLCKMLPLSTDLEYEVSRMDEADAGMLPVNEEPKKQKKAERKSRLDALADQHEDIPDAEIVDEVEEYPTTDIDDEPPADGFDV